jgi:hypothetical protein
MAPSYANLFMDFLEQDFLHSRPEKLSLWVHFIDKKCNAFYIGEKGQMLSCKWAPVLLHGCELLPTGTHPHKSSLSRNAGPSVSLTNC